MAIVFKNTCFSDAVKEGKQIENILNDWYTVRKRWPEISNKGSTKLTRLLAYLYLNILFSLFAP